jgi:hypothetical protein
MCSVNVRKGNIISHTHSFNMLLVALNSIEFKDRSQFSCALCQSISERNAQTRGAPLSLGKETS